MAEGLLRERIAESLESRVSVSSAGTAGMDGFPASDLAQVVARENGVDLSGFRSSALDERRIEEANLILVMSPQHRAMVLALVPGAEDRTHLLRDYGGTASSPGEGVPDPFGGTLERYRQSWSQISEAIEGILPKLRDLSGEISES
jgi:protein-tyrosine-phosphatase